MPKFFGKVERWKGDFQPTFGVGYPHGTITEVAIPLIIFKGKIKPVKKLDNHPQFLMKIDKYDAHKGFVTPNLEPGTYTIVMDIDGELYLNGYHYDGDWYSYELGSHDIMVDLRNDQGTTW